MELGEARHFGETAVLEAQIAVPYAMGELGAYAQALERYEAAIAVFERESADLNESIAAIRAGMMIEGLVERNSARRRWAGSGEIERPGQGAARRAI